MHRTILLGGLFFVFAMMMPEAAWSAVVASDEQIVHLLNRVTFGPAPGDIAAVKTMGVNLYIEQQLHPESLSPSSSLEARLAALPTLRASMSSLADNYEPPAGQKQNLSEEQRKEINQRRNEIVKELSEAKILRGVMSPAQLQEVMTDFWYNHFNVFAEKGADKIFCGRLRARCYSALCS